MFRVREGIYLLRMCPVRWEKVFSEGVGFKDGWIIEVCIWYDDWFRGGSFLVP